MNAKLIRFFGKKHLGSFKSFEKFTIISKFNYFKFSSSNNNSNNVSNSNNNDYFVKNGIKIDENCNITDNIKDKLGRNIYLIKNHPLNILSNKMKKFFTETDLYDVKEFKIFENLSPVVSTEECFKNLLVSEDHETLSNKNTFYVNKDNVLRTHMTTHDVSFLRQENNAFISIGDVYRRDTVDITHYPVFHQLDGVRVFKNKSKEEVFEDLKQCLEKLIFSIVGKVQYKWVDAYFPFTDPSAELEIYYQDKWLEVLGCGVFRDGVLEKAGINPKTNTAWAFGIGLERIAMTLFAIPDIRLFWTNDQRFLNQFKEGQITKFKSFSKFPPCYKDFAFYINQNYNENDFHHLIREICGDIAEDVKLIDDFTNKDGKRSHCYRVNFRSMERSLTNIEVNDLQSKIRNNIKENLKLELK